jgi:protein-S-isoprenylcysteine O-methyltransferase Ste14
MNYTGGGLLASNLILTLVPVVFFGLMIALRIEEEESMLVAEYGERYQAYMANTGRFLPFL